nr:condensation domain-containing protein [Bacillus pumilus]
MITGKSRLEGAPLLDLPTDFDRPEVRQFRGGHYTFRIEEAELNAFKQMILKEDATLFMGLLSVYQILLHKLSGQSDITVGVPVAGRKQEEPRASHRYLCQYLATSFIS